MNFLIILMTMIKTTIKKQYYSLAELAIEKNISTQFLRGLVHRLSLPYTERKGNRMYFSQEQKKNIVRVLIARTFLKESIIKKYQLWKHPQLILSVITALDTLYPKNCEMSFKELYE